MEGKYAASDRAVNRENRYAFPDLNEEAEAKKRKIEKISYILFRTDRDGFVILCSRGRKSQKIPVGRSLAAVLTLDQEAMLYLTREESRQPPLFLDTGNGIGLLSKYYDRHAGIGMYLHIHESRASLSRLLRSDLLQGCEDGSYAVSSGIPDRGVLQKRDERNCGFFLETWLAIRDHHKNGGFFKVRSGTRLMREDLEQGLETLASFAGERLQVIWSCDSDAPAATDVLPPTWVTCYRPILLEALILCLLTEAHSLSEVGTDVSCSLASQGEQRRLSIELSYTISPKKLRSAEYVRAEEARQHLEKVAQLGGMLLLSHISPARKAEAEATARTVTLSLACVTNPAILSTSDLKAGLRLLYGEPSKPGPGMTDA
jgi:hypothetical protein